MNTSSSKVVTALIAASLLTTMIAAPAEARRGGSFGSRGSRTYYSPRSTQIAPGYTSGISRSMTPSRAPQAQYGSSYNFGFGQRARPRFGFGSGLLAGVVAGGLFGSLVGHGGGGYGASDGGGMLALLIQLGIIGGLIWLALRWFRGRGLAATSVASPPFVRSEPYQRTGETQQPFAGSTPLQTSDLAITPADQNAFEQLLVELQDAFGHEDYGRLRAIATPEIMSYLAEELSDNATHGRRNDVTDTRLIDAEVSEAWRDESTDYATIAMRYESIDVMRDRTTGTVLGGDASRPTHTTEIWTFSRPSGAWGTWKVSAIQET